MVTIRPMTSTDIPAAIRTWRDTTTKTQDVDAPDELLRYFDRNPGCSFVAEYTGVVIGLALCGHDGRRGYLHHLGVVAAYRRNGIGKHLTECCFESLKKLGITRVHLQLKESNVVALRFWKSLGVRERNDLVTISVLLSGVSESGMSA